MHTDDYRAYGATEEHGGAGFLMGLLAGTALGAAIGLLLAPKSGAEMRRTLVDSAERFRQKANETYRDASSAVGDLVDRGRNLAREGRQRVEQAVDEAKSAYNDEVSANREGGSSSTARPY